MDAIAFAKVAGLASSGIFAGNGSIPLLFVLLRCVLNPTTLRRLEGPHS